MLKTVHAAVNDKRRLHCASQTALIDAAFCRKPFTHRVIALAKSKPRW